MKRQSIYSLLFFVFIAQINVFASEITLTGSQESGIVASLTLEKPEFHETLGVGLADTRYDNIGYVDFGKESKKSISIAHKSPVIINLTIAPKPGNKSIQARTYPLFLEKDDQLTVEVLNNGKLRYSGTHASRQEFLSNYFLENHYQHLPALGYRPSAPEFNHVDAQIDSLQNLRVNAFGNYKSQNPSDENSGFAQYIKARMLTEPYLLKTFVADKKMRQNRALKLSGQQRNELDEFALNNFIVLTDDALLSKSYRDELRHWIQIPIKRKYPNDSLYQYPVTPNAIADLYKASQEKLANFPAQKKYLLTYWLNYASTALTSPETAQLLIKEYKNEYPNSMESNYFEALLSAKEKLKTGMLAPALKLLNTSRNEVSLPLSQEKPVCLIFAFNLNQFEADLKQLEAKYAGKVQFVYVCISPSIPFDFWQKNTKSREGVIQLWADQDEIKKIKQNYVTEITYPFVVIDKKGTIQQRWIAQQFPDNRYLDAALQTAVR